VATNSVRLAPLLNACVVSDGPPSTVIIPRASQLAKLQEITVRGILLKNQFANWDSRTLKTRFSVGRRGGRYALRADGSLEFCIGVKALQPHIACILDDAESLVSLLNNSVGEKITVNGFLRSCLRKSGLGSAGHDDARVFEIRPVRSIEIAGDLHAFDLFYQASTVHDWTEDLNVADESRSAQYWKGNDTFRFSNIGSEKDAYFRVVGTVSDVKLNIGFDRPAWLLLDSANASRQMRVTCLQGTRAAKQLRRLRSTRASVVGLRSLDLARALEDRYRINFLAIDIEPA